MSWIIPSSLTNRGNRRYDEFLEKCKDDAVNKSIPIIDETNPKYFPYVEENCSLPIPIIIEGNKKVSKNRKYSKGIGVIEYIINAISIEHKQLSTTIRRRKQSQTKEEKEEINIIAVIPPQKNTQKNRKKAAAVAGVL